jgi:hypothetical protein
MRVISLPYFLETIAFDLDSEGYSVTPVRTGLQNHDDFSNKLFVYLHDGSYECLGCVDIEGNLIHAYSNIQTTSFICVANGFLIRSTKSVSFLWPNDGYQYYSLAISNILKHKNHIFDFLATVSGLYQVEISKGSPTEVYEITPSGASSLPILQSYTNEVDDFDTIDTEYSIYDARVFDFNVPSGITLASGIIGDNWRYCGIATDDGIRAFPTTLSGESLQIISIAGARHLETTNNTSNPYFFISTDVASGILASGRFYQRDPDSESLVDYSSGLPNSAITIIRTDDLI